ncbi:amidase family protein [Amycolatopsis jejuensis]|uniref:amidase family protein n=1 Tax=Amycolatopsis jejuensis TaxID=330084 RepID=UPI00068AC9B1|nr:amidase family protein [Amycolatopsis jejuensis]
MDTTSLAEWQRRTVTERRGLVASSAEHAQASEGVWITVAEPAAAGSGPLAGIAFAVKDNIDVAGLATTAGTPLLRDHIADLDADVVNVLRDAGAVVLGKTNMHELAFGVTSDNATFGAVRNPQAPGLSAGGSSGGSAAAVALGTVPFSLGTDTGGSVTVPAAFCGIAGFRPSTGRYPPTGVVSLSTSRDTIGIHARTVEDIRIVDEIITREPRGPEPGEVVLGVPRNRYQDVAPEVAEAAGAALAVLTNAGVRLEDVVVPDDLALGAGPGLDLALFEAPRSLLRHLAAIGSRYAGVPLAGLTPHIASPDVRAIFEGLAESPVPVPRYAAARQARWQLRRSYADVFTQVDALLWPTSPVLPPRLGDAGPIVLNGRSVPLFHTVIRNVGPGTVAGQPMVSLPVGDGVGLCLEGPVFGDERLLRIARRVEGLLAAVA